MSEFKLLDRSAGSTILLIPGWATDYRIFNPMDIKANYLVPVRFSPLDFEKNLFDEMDKNDLDKVSIMGWSMGGFMAFDLAKKHPPRFDSVTLVSVRERYEGGEIKETMSYLKKNKTAFLYKFYNDCFSKNERDELSRFKKELMKDYLNTMSLDTLLDGLEYLSGSRITPPGPNGMKVRFVHGEEDRIAPVEEARSLSEKFPGSKFIPIETAGHIPFLKNDFDKILND
ncbi:MAG: alpha/beta fold hydrolase [Candidatus Omnitrophota bacterium]|nr:alpha/beta fold hydrolase [Candidatus Omnitrophota bacterium]